MDDYGIDDVLVDLDALENDNLMGDEFVAAIARIREYVDLLAAETRQIEASFALVGDDR